MYKREDVNQIVNNDYLKGVVSDRWKMALSVSYTSIVLVSLFNNEHVTHTLTFKNTVFI
jgi:hypothetical protein